MFVSVPRVINRIFKEGDFISLDGTTGHVYEGKIETTEATISGNFETFMAWVDEIRDLKIKANADSPEEAKVALEFGAEGIGLCRTEHMFFDESRIFAFRKMILSDTKEGREEALESILPFQRKDFEDIYRTMSPYSVIIRYLDPPLHEFLPKVLPQENKVIEEIAEALGVTVKRLKQRIQDLHEFNPMMGHRGCRVAITYPEIAVMQTKAVIEAAINVQKEGKKVIPEIMIPLISDKNELKYLTDIVRETAEELIKNSGEKLEYKIGAMIELPRACIKANELAEIAEFFSLGTNDLTQMAYGFSRDDGAFLNDYYKKQIFSQDPFVRLDQEGVGQLIKMAINRGRQKRPDIEIGICGEHGGEASSIEFFYNADMDYVSCSPYRVPIARLAAAQARIKSGMQK